MSFGVGTLFLMKLPWWKNGVQFQCQGSGRCCVSRGQYGYVYMTLSDRRRMAKALGLTTAAFTRKHCTKKDGWVYLNSPDQSCQFLDGKRCGIYEGRPTQCRTWPFWPENMSAKAWAKEVASYCPGVGKGPIVSAEEIQKELDAESRNND